MHSSLATVSAGYPLLLTASKSRQQSPKNYFTFFPLYYYRPETSGIHAVYRLVLLLLASLLLVAKLDMHNPFRIPWCRLSLYYDYDINMPSVVIYEYQWDAS